MYCTRSAGGLGGGQTGQGGCAHPAVSTISARTKRRMWVIYLEIAAALLIAGLIVWFTWPKKPK
jgi:hypothetical protein